MIHRIAEDALRRLASQFPVVGVTGPRQSGKTTLAKAVFPDKKYVTLDDRPMRELASANPRDFLMAFSDGAIIDEAQKAPEIFDALKMAVDGKPTEPGKFILTGSSQFRLQSNMTDSLAGRAAFLRLLPFSVAELKAADCLPETAYDLIYNGQYPPLYDSDKHFIPEDWYESYIDTYLDLDVRDQINATNLATFRRFIQVCAAHSGEIFSMEKIGREVGVSGPTIKKWLSVLEASFIIHFLELVQTNRGLRGHTAGGHGHRAEAGADSRKHRPGRLPGHGAPRGVQLCRGEPCPHEAVCRFGADRHTRLLLRLCRAVLDFRAAHCRRVHRG